MLAACAAPVALKGAGRTWKRVESLLVPESICINPDYVNAPFEVVWSHDVHTFKILDNKPRISADYIQEVWPIRMDKDKIPIQPFIYKRYEV